MTRAISGSWTGYPVYEDLAAAILSWYPSPQLVSAMEGTMLTPTQLDGAARLCSGKYFQTPAENGESMCLIFPGTQYLGPSGQITFIPRRSGAPVQIPRGLRGQLLDYCLQYGDEDKRSRALSAFTP